MADAAVVLSVISDLTKLPGPQKDLVGACRSTDSRHLRVGVPSAYILALQSELPRDQHSSFEAAARALAAVGVDVVANADFPETDAVLALRSELSVRGRDPTYGFELGSGAVCRVNGI